MGRVERSRQCAAKACAELAFEFDEAGRLATLTYPDSKGALSDKSERLTHRYDSAGRLSSFAGRDLATNTDTAYASQLAYDPLGQLKRLEHSNGVVDTRSYDNRRHWLDTLEVIRPGAAQPLYRASHGHHPDGNISTLTETPGGLEQKYDYDDLGRLTSATATPERTRTYSYDALGRMTSSSTAGSYSYSDPAHIHAPTSTDKGHRRSYDPNGNLRTLHDPGGRRLTIDWTTSDMPQRITPRRGRATVIGYDADDQRVLKRDRHGTTYYVSRYLERGPKGRLVKHYWVGDQLIARRDGTGKLTNFHHDRLGSTRLLTDARGVVVERHDYDPFGKPLKQLNRDERLWQGQRHDQDSGLIYMNARFYDPELGRFASADSIIPDAYSSQALDRYAYCENDWANCIDPSGHRGRDIELKQEQERRGLLFATMYSRTRADQNACAYYTGQCPQPDRPIHKNTPGQAKPQGGSKQQTTDATATDSVTAPSSPEPRQGTKASTDTDPSTDTKAPSDAGGKEASATAFESFSFTSKVAAEAIGPTGPDGIPLSAELIESTTKERPWVPPPSVADPFLKINAWLEKKAVELGLLTTSDVDAIHILTIVGSLPALGESLLAKAERLAARPAGGTATVYQQGRHAVVEVAAGDSVLRTEQVILKPSTLTTIREVELLGPGRKLTLNLPDAERAMAYQRSVLNRPMGLYNAETNSCLTHCGNVLRAGGLDVPNTTRSINRWLRAQRP